MKIAVIGGLGGGIGVRLTLNGLGQAALQLHDPVTARTHFAVALKVLVELSLDTRKRMTPVSKALPTALVDCGQPLMLKRRT